MISGTEEVPSGWGWRAGRRLVVVLAFVAALLSSSVSAEAPPTRVILSYIPTISNWGPTEANGVVLVSYSEGDIRADLVGLPPNEEQERYQLWLLNSITGLSFPLGRFAVQASEAVTYVDQQLTSVIPEQGWDYVVVTVEPEPGEADQPGDRRSIAGAIPGTSAEIQQFPPTLPQTGIAPNRSREAGLEMFLAGSLPLVTLFVLRRSIKRSRMRDQRLEAR